LIKYSSYKNEKNFRGKMGEVEEDIILSEGSSNEDDVFEETEVAIENPKIIQEIGHDRAS
jgi:hypothetical protein